MRAISSNAAKNASTALPPRETPQPLSALKFPIPNVDDINVLSPELAELYQVLADNEIFLINQAVAAMRDSAWRFAIVLALMPGFAHVPYPNPYQPLPPHSR